MAIKTATRVDPFADPRTRGDAARMGMGIFLVGVAMLFGASILGYLVVRLDPERHEPWRAIADPELPHSLILSTLVIVALSAALHASRAAAARDDARACGRWARAAALLAGGFLVCQAYAWWIMVREDLRLQDGLYAWTFYVLTALHAAHVLGGLPSLGVVAVRAGAGRYRGADRTGLDLCTMYWDALGVIWGILYMVLWLGS